MFEMKGNNMKYNRQEAIDYLVKRDIADIEQMLADNDTVFIESILSAGFYGYETLTNPQLAEEIQHSTSDEEEVIVE